MSVGVVMVYEENKQVKVQRSRRGITVQPPVFCPVLFKKRWRFGNLVAMVPN